MNFAKIIALFGAVSALALSLVSCATTPTTTDASATLTPTQAGATKLSVTYVNWKNFSDIMDRFDWTEEGEIAILKELEASLQQDAKVYVPNGDHLAMTITDIHLAGRYEPSISRRRIINGTNPPRFEFTYSLTNGAGQVIKSGKENLVDADFQSHIPMTPGDPLHYEKDMLNTWMQQKMAGL